MDYWSECVQGALEEAGITVSPEQLRTVTDAVKTGHEMYAECMGYHCIPNPLREENEKLRRELKIEQSKIVCPECRGTGRIISQFGTLESDSECSVCHGEGYVVP